jgi:hypothetical protein
MSAFPGPGGACGLNRAAHRQTDPDRLAASETSVLLPEGFGPS